MSIRIHHRGKDSPVKRRFSNRFGPFVVLSGLLGTAACGGPRMQPPPAVHADFRAIQRAEADLARSVARADDTTLACVARCEATEDARRASDAACRAAGNTSDADAQVRCTRSAGRAAAAVQTVGLSCTCTEAR